MGYAENILCTADIDIGLQPHGPRDESPVPITYEDGWTHRDSVDVEEKMSQFVSGVEHGRPANTMRLQASSDYCLADVRRNRMQVKRHGSDVIILRHLLLYEGWNFNSGKYLFTTDTK